MRPMTPTVFAAAAALGLWFALPSVMPAAAQSTGTTTDTTTTTTDTGTTGAATTGTATTGTGTTTGTTDAGSATGGTATGTTGTATGTDTGTAAGAATDTGTAAGTAAPAEGTDTAAAGEEDKPYHVGADGKVDWYTFSGFRRYHAECHVCHGPDALGSSFAPALANSLKTMTYEQFLDVVTNGRVHVDAANQNRMPAFGNNANVMCFVDDIYAYLKARADNAIGRGRPPSEDKPQEAKERDLACMGGSSG